jgi:hypothetical protein
MSNSWNELDGAPSLARLYDRYGIFLSVVTSPRLLQILGNVALACGFTVQRRARLLSFIFQARSRPIPLTPD